MEASLTGLPLPIILRPPSPLTDDELIAFSRRNKPYRIEKDKHGDLIIRNGLGYASAQRLEEVSFQLSCWARKNGTGESNGFNVGWNLQDGSTLSPAPHGRVMLLWRTSAMRISKDFFRPALTS